VEAEAERATVVDDVLPVPLEGAEVLDIRPQRPVAAP
jgi:hypothetical protein